MSNEIYSPSRRGFLKGLAVGAGGYALGSMLIHPKEAMGQSIEGCLEKVPMEARWDYTSGNFLSSTVNYFKTLYDQGGKEKYVEFMKENGRIAEAGYKGLADRFGFTGNDAKSAAAIIGHSCSFLLAPDKNLKLKKLQRKKQG